MILWFRFYSRMSDLRYKTCVAWLNWQVIPALKSSLIDSKHVVIKPGSLIWGRTVEIISKKEKENLFDEKNSKKVKKKEEKLLMMHTCAEKAQLELKENFQINIQIRWTWKIRKKGAKLREPTKRKYKSNRCWVTILKNNVRAHLCNANDSSPMQMRIYLHQYIYRNSQSNDLHQMIIKGEVCIINNRGLFFFFFCIKIYINWIHEISY